MKRISLLLFATVLATISPLPGAVVNDCDETSLRAAIATGEPVVFACDGTIVLSNTIVIEASTEILDARGRSVTISGTNRVRIFEVLSQGRLYLLNLSLVHGLAKSTNTPSVAKGGAIYVGRGHVEAYDCEFIRNVAAGYDGVYTNGFAESGGSAAGGAIGGEEAAIHLSNCVFEANSAVGGAGSEPPLGSILPAGFGGGGSGGAIECTGCRPVALTNCTFEANSALPGGQSGRLPPNLGSKGGAISLWNATLYGVGSIWRGNAALSSGGAIDGGIVNLNACRFEGNIAGPGAPAKGGAIHGLLETISDCYFADNAALGLRGFIQSIHAVPGGSGEGGAIWQDTYNGMEPLIINSTFVRNRAIGGEGMIGGPPGPPAAGSGFGGAIYTSGGSTGSVLSIANSTFGHNEARSGAINAWGSTGLGGAIYHGGKFLSVYYSTIASNHVSDGFTNNAFGGGIWATNEVELGTSVLVGNKANNAPQNMFGKVTDYGYSLSSDATPVFDSGSSLNDVDVRLEPLADNGGPTPTFALGLDSPAVDFVPSETFFLVDQRGIFRPQLKGFDAGAFEQTRMRYLPANDRASVRFAYTGVPHSTYVLERRTPGEPWTPVGTNTATVQGYAVFPAQMTGDAAQAFFRVSFRR